MLIPYKGGNRNLIVENPGRHNLTQVIKVNIITLNRTNQHHVPSDGTPQRTLYLFSTIAAKTKNA